ncbi:hypothetical protein SUGI_0038100 [Cryptomeria japonica]|nr:hypothetical protein SUGI_0038100 [Cryptomeria japonica]
MVSVILEWWFWVASLWHKFVMSTSVGWWMRAFAAMADVEPVDPRPHIEESCKPNCVKPLLQYQACGKRVEADETGHKHCTGQYFDYLSCIDKCAATKIFANLK